MYRDALDVGLMVLAGLIAMPTLTLLAEVMAATKAELRSPISKSGRPPRVAILIPAHDEESVICATLRSIIPQLNEPDRLLVVADNCSDGTARIAREVGAEVLTRTDHVQRGKGYALDYGVRHLEDNPPDVLIIIDADCLVEPGAIGCLAWEAASTHQPIQALYLMDAPEGAGLGLRIAEFAWVLKNRVRPLGLQRWGLPCQLMGTGMAFPWSCVKAAPLATGHIVEDLRLGIDLALDGYPPLFCPSALVRSRFPASSDGVRSQRTRWEHGHLKTILQDTPRLLGRSLARRDIKLAAMAADLAVPPLALLALWFAGIWAASLVNLYASNARAAFVLSTAVGLTFSLAIGVSWWRFGRHIITAADLALAPLYAAAKIPLYLKFLLNPQSRWVRSSRDRDP